MTDLIPVERVDAIELFTGGGLDNLLSDIEAAALDFEVDLETTAGRKACASQAYKVRRSKTVIDDAGKEVVAEWKAKAKLIDEGRKKARDFLDDLAERVRAPLTQIEEEEKRAKEAREAAERLKQEIMQAEEEAYREDALRERERLAREEEARLRAAREQIEREAAEQARQKRDEEIRQKTVEAIQMEAELKAAREVDAALKREREAVLQAQRSALAAEQAAGAERARIEAEQRKEEEGKRKREADRAHRVNVNNAALHGLCTALEGVTKPELVAEFSRAVIVAIARGQVPHVSLNY